MTTELGPTITQEHGEASSRTARPNTMRAIVQRRYGSADSLELAQVPRPDFGSDEVLIEVHAAGVDRGVVHLMAGTPYLIRLMGFGVRRPKTPVPGMDVSGRVVAIGADVERFRVGDEVFGIAKGSYAEYATATESKLTHKPASITHEQAGAIAISGITALQAVEDIADVRPGQTVLVLGASGGVGSYAVQIAKTLGATVTGVASGAKADMVRSLGADEVIDYSTTDYLDGRNRYDVIIDTGGLNPLRQLRKALNNNGTLVIVGGEGGGRWTGGIGRQLRAVALSPFVSQRLTMFISEEHHGRMKRLATLIESGEVAPAVSEEFDLVEVPEAIRRLEAGQISGKAVIVVPCASNGS